MKTKIIHPISLFCVSFGILGSWSATATNKSGKPNVLLILADDLGYHDVSYYGTSDIRTPNIDNLCKAGMRLIIFMPTLRSVLQAAHP